MESSRLFVRNLPPTITEAEFRKHFSSGGREITDVKLMPGRRIGYVGYKTPEVAAKAVSYFNKTYIRLSRIAVEPAKTINDPSLPRSRRSKQDETLAPVAQPEVGLLKNQETTAKKRKREELDENDPKLKEFMEVMGTAQVASNKLEGITDQAALERSREAAVVHEGSESDDEYENIPTRPLKRPKDEGEPSPLPPSTVAASQIPEVPTVSPQTDATPADIVPKETQQVDGTDDDWLRSRTNRLLDLVDPDDPAMLSTGTAPHQPTTILAAATVQQEPGAIDTAQDAAQEAQEAHGESAVTGDSEESNSSVIQRTARLFVRNLPYSATEEDLRHLFEAFGELQEVHLPLGRSGASKGYALIHFADATSALSAFQSADGTIFQGRILHIIGGAPPKKDGGLDDFEISKLPLKKQNLIRKRAQAASSTFNWNSLYMAQDAVNESVAHRLGVSKSELLDPTSTDAAVKQAMAETSVILETKAYFAAHGVDLDAFKSQKKGDTAILVKNIPFGITIEEVRRTFEEHGTVLQVLMPPSKTIAIVQFKSPVEARAAFAKLAYRRIKDSVLFLEKAPQSLFISENQEQAAKAESDQDPRPTAGVQKLSVSELLERDDDQEPVDTTSLFVRGLNFATTTEKLAATFKPLDGFVSARVKSRTDPKKGVLSMGFGFVEFRTKEQAHAAIKVMDGHVLEGHTLAVKASHKGLDAAEERRREDRAKKAAGQRTKIVIKNLPFEASKKDVRTLFGAYGTLRALRIPKKFGNASSRGFAFAEFVTPREAENALNALRDTHLLGRKLVLDFAEADAVDPEEQIKKMESKIRGQVNKVALQQLTGRGRAKVNIGNEEDGDEV